MLKVLAKQSAIYGVSTIVGRLLGYLLTPYFTRIFEREEYGIITDLYALIPFALVVLSLGMESSYFRYAAKAEEQNSTLKAITEAKERLFSTTWGITTLAAIGFMALATLFLSPIAEAMGEAYTNHKEYVLIVAGIVFFDVCSLVPFARLRERGEAVKYVGIKLVAITLQVGFSFGFGFAGLYASEFGVGWALVANLISSAIAWGVVIFSIKRPSLAIDKALLRSILIYSTPLLLSGIAGTASDFIDRQMIKYIIPQGAMAQLGIYGAVAKIAVVMTLFTQMYRLAAEPFFLSNFKKEDFKELNAAVMKYFIMASMFIFLGIALFRDLFALIVGGDYREGIYILPVILGANILMGVWLNLSFWYKREERTNYALYITLSGVVVAILANLALVPRWGYFGAAWARLLSEGVMCAVSYYLCMRHYPTPYNIRRIVEYVALALLLYAGCEYIAEHHTLDILTSSAISVVAITIYSLFAIWHEKIDVVAMLRSIIKR
ncbi:MAG: oligosaccharide flippase family protein [Rikenellaceae bacterium]